MRIRPRGDELETGMDVPRMIGIADSAAHPWDWDDETAQELADELAERLARKKPLGFAPWPSSEAGEGPDKT